MFHQYLIATCSVLVLSGCTRPRIVPASGFLEGHLTIVSLKEVEPAEAAPSKGTSANYAEYPLAIFNADTREEAARVVADTAGHYRVALPAGHYLLDAAGRGSRLVRAQPKPFTVVPNQTIRVDFELDTGVR